MENLSGASGIASSLDKAALAMHVLPESLRQLEAAATRAVASHLPVRLATALLDRDPHHPDP